MNKIRVFVAININLEIREYLSSLRNSIDIPQSKIKWVGKNNLHITLKFLGYQPPEKIKLISSGLKEISHKHNSFKIKISPYMGVFPNYKMPRIIWVGIGEGTNELKKLYNSVEIILFKKGFERESKEFSGHITIGRIKYFKKGNNLNNILEKIDIKTMSQKIKSIELMKSNLTPKGPIYSVLEKYPLKGINY